VPFKYMFVRVTNGHESLVSYASHEVQNPLVFMFMLVFIQVFFVFIIKILIFIKMIIKRMNMV
jgi:hypothetical protein